ncbi:hypothetical protein BDW02DRAFT_337338 [Decorospora gaudefroyi]|uniref:Uncharacterized protein n=1 Tax=Decorospora gaudefroyi TaxID=184978 RepID=A0A6A5KK34_9PLEO|nr:hypothetical protein BDW02DRAFT_337338 [Decorospora gaudefroyi]
MPILNWVHPRKKPSKSVLHLPLVIGLPQVLGTALLFLFLFYICELSPAGVPLGGESGDVWILNAQPTSTETIQLTREFQMMATASGVRNMVVMTSTPLAGPLPRLSATSSSGQALLHLDLLVVVHRTGVHGHIDLLPTPPTTTNRAPTGVIATSVPTATDKPSEITEIGEAEILAPVAIRQSPVQRQPFELQLRGDNTAVPHGPHFLDGEIPALHVPIVREHGSEIAPTVIDPSSFMSVPATYMTNEEDSTEVVQSNAKFQAMPGEMLLEMFKQGLTFPGRVLHPGNKTHGKGEPRLHVIDPEQRRPTVELEPLVDFLAIARVGKGLDKFVLEAFLKHNTFELISDGAYDFLQGLPLEWIRLIAHVRFELNLVGSGRLLFWDALNTKLITTVGQSCSLRTVTISIVAQGDLSPEQIRARFRQIVGLDLLSRYRGLRSFVVEAPKFQLDAAEVSRLEACVRKPKARLGMTNDPTLYPALGPFPFAVNTLRCWTHEALNRALESYGQNADNFQSKVAKATALEPLMRQEYANPGDAPRQKRSRKISANSQANQHAAVPPNLPAPPPAIPSTSTTNPASANDQAELGGSPDANADNTEYADAGEGTEEAEEAVETTNSKRRHPSEHEDEPKQKLQKLE